MARGSAAKEIIKKKIASAFGENYIGEVGGKLYLWENDGGERVQIAIAMTCPKVFIEAEDAGRKEDFDWGTEGSTSAPAPKPKVEITEEEQKKIADLMSKLGL